MTCRWLVIALLAFAPSTVPTGVAAMQAGPVADPARSAIRTMEFVYDTAPYPQSHASTIVQTRGGTIAAAWFGGTYERHPDVEIWFARRGPAKWDTPRSVATGIQPDGTRLPTWNPVLFQDPKGPLHLFYKVGPSPQQWWGMVISSIDEGRSWSRRAACPTECWVRSRTSRWFSPTATGCPRPVRSRRTAAAGRCISSVAAMPARRGLPRRRSIRGPDSTRSSRAC